MSKIIISALGDNFLNETEYEFEGRRHPTRFCSIALSQILSKPPSRLLVLLTPEARKKHEEALSNECRDLNLSIEILPISSGKTIQEVWKVFDALVEKVSSHPSMEVLLDITNSFRHLPLLFFTSLSYLESAGKAGMKGVYYGAYDAKNESNITPVFDLTPMVNLVKGGFAVKSFMETGAMGPLGSFLGSLPGVDPRTAVKLTQSLSEFQRIYSAGLPLEAGSEAEEILKKFPSLTIGVENLTAGFELREKLRDHFRRIALETPNGDNWKTRFHLDMQELARQLKFIEGKILHGDASQAIILLREWIISRVCFSEGKHESWLEKGVRVSEIESKLGKLALRKREESAKDKPTEVSLSKTWDKLSNFRNEFGHAGFKKTEVNVQSALKKASEFLRICLDNLENEDFWRVPSLSGNDGLLLVSGLGSSVGLLFSALSSLKPDRTVVITSKEVEPKLPEVLKSAGGYPSEHVKALILQEPFTGFSETGGMVKALEPFLKNASEVVVNLTGGTTCMQWVMQAVFEKARELGAAVRRVAFVDRRTTQEQQKNPFVLGEMIPIDGSSVSGRSEKGNPAAAEK